MFVRGNECIEQTDDDETVKKECKRRKWDLKEDIRQIKDRINVQENMRQFNDKMKFEENIKNIKDKLDLEDNIRQITDKVNEKKQLEVNKAMRAWIGLRRRVKKWRFVDALRIKREEVDEGDGKVYLQSPRGKSNIYTFRKPSLR